MNAIKLVIKNESGSHQENLNKEWKIEAVLIKILSFSNKGDIFSV